MGTRSTATGPRAFSIRYAVAGGPYTESATGILANNSIWETKVNTVSVSEGEGQVITIRIYGYDGTGTTAINTANWRLDDIVIATTTSLPVVFGNVMAVKNANRLKVSWTTLRETNNSHFLMEASVNGTDFTAVKTIASQKRNADHAQHYVAEINLTDIPVVPISISLALACLASAGRRNTAALVVLSVFIIWTGIISCNKTAEGVKDNLPRLFIRIKQVDVDGRATYSRVIEAVEPQ